MIIISYCYHLVNIVLLCYNDCGGDNMSISKNNTRTLITIPKDLKQQLEQIAKKENRSFNNLVVTILKSYADSSPIVKV